MSAPRPMRLSDVTLTFAAPGDFGDPIGTLTRISGERLVATLGWFVRERRDVLAGDDPADNVQLSLRDSARPEPAPG